MNKCIFSLLHAAVLSGIPAGHGEAFNILRYENNQHYDSHYDAFEEAMYGRQESQRVCCCAVLLDWSCDIIKQIL